MIFCLVACYFLFICYIFMFVSLYMFVCLYVNNLNIMKDLRYNKSVMQMKCYRRI
jgi:hypothetical protein